MKQLNKTLYFMLVCVLSLLFTACSGGGPLTASEVHDKAEESVGEVVTYNQSGTELSLGSCFVYTSDGKLVTNYHVIEDAYSAKVTINDETYVVQTILAYDKDIDLAVLKVNTSGLTPIETDKEEQEVGKPVYAFGSSRGLTATFSQGIITYADRIMEDVHYIQHDAAISGGNSGGPLINEYGKVIGINTMAMRDSQNLNFAISVKEIDNLIFGTPLTVAQFYDKECNPFMKVKNFAMQRGTYDASDSMYTYNLHTWYSSDYATRYQRKVAYNAADAEIELMLFVDSSFDALISVYIDEVDGSYKWIYVDTNDYYMMGTVYASTYTSSTLLGYTSNNVSSSSLRSSLRELASTMVDNILLNFDDDYASIGVEAEDFGFYNY